MSKYHFMHLYPNLPICKMGIIMFSIIWMLKRLGIIYCDNISDNRSKLNVKKIKWRYNWLWLLLENYLQLTLVKHWKNIACLLAGGMFSTRKWKGGGLPVSFCPASCYSRQECHISFRVRITGEEVCYSLLRNLKYKHKKKAW